MNYVIKRTSGKKNFKQKQSLEIGIADDPEPSFFEIVRFRISFCQSQFQNFMFSIFETPTSVHAWRQKGDLQSKETWDYDWMNTQDENLESICIELVASLTKKQFSHHKTCKQTNK